MNAFIAPCSLSAFSSSQNARHICARPLFTSASRYRRAISSSAATPADVTSVANTGDVDAAQVERSFDRLRHPNPIQRKAACSYLASVATPAVISRLLELLPEQDTNYRRAAVQALGMCGEPAVTPVVDILRTTEDGTARASCAKALAATALFHPDLRAQFPTDALAALRDAVMGADPVTKIASVGCLGTLGCDAKGREGTDPGCDEAYDILAAMVADGVDVGTGAVAVGALAQIGQNGSAERKADVVSKLKVLADGSDGDDDDSGLGYVREMARAHVEQLEGGLKTPDKAIEE